MSMQQTAEGMTRPAGRPRSEKAEKAIIDATLDLLGEGIGVSELSIEAIAARAGVGKTTIYRRWSNKEDLVVDAMATLKPPIPLPQGASVRESLVTYLKVIAEESRHQRTRCIMNIALSDPDRHPRLAERFREVALEPRREIVRAILAKGIETGELRGDLDVDIAMAIISGAMMWQTKWVWPGEATEARLPERIVEEALKGFRQRAAEN
ncbi:TetR/AcrR family transcriptional regulator [Microbispora sp. RL4-1S]|uniref:TetR/AcrR family transcriptional regulator n=1 Tax=Microbispora oryzae TaxID=2806554 RepID=A0A940WDG0_9ACTN|nr:TetR/AcrR family transcriptional regulator [Microbispora oryzae]MBP2702548.1 TetR/AcrR family transcriptional regulator [Microbispora oryzae]